MSLRFIMGSSGSGKSTYLYEEIVRLAREYPEQTFYVIVPEQFTMQTQRELVEKSGSGIMNIDVVSFQRLAYRVFDEIGKMDMVVLEETGKNLLLRKVAEDKKEELQVLSGNMKKMGYISEIKSLISELTQYHISPEALEDFLRAEGIGEPQRAGGKRNALSGVFSRKMEDILIMYRGFEEALEGKYITAEEILDVFESVAAESKLLRGSVLAFDGFTGFTPIQNQLLQRLMTLTSDIYVTITMDAREDAYTFRGMQELFAMSKKTVSSLVRMAEKAKIPLEEPVWLIDEEKSRFADSPMLSSLERNLFRLQAKPYGENDGSIRMYSLENQREELSYAAGEIKRLVREEGYRYKDIAVVSGDVESYGNYVSQIFSVYDIPYFLDTTKNILLHPFLEFVRAVLEILENNFTYESIFRYFRSNLVLWKKKEEEETPESVRERKVDAALIDRLENYVLAAGIRGYKAWSKRFSCLPRQMSEEQLEELEAFRKEQMELFAPLWEVFRRKHATVREQSLALYEFMRTLSIEQQLKNREDEYREQGDFVKEKEYAQIYRIVMDLLDKMTSLLGDEELSIKEYTEILDAGFEVAKVGVIPTGYDRVTVGDIERTRLEHIKVLFFLGVNDGIVPKNDTRGGIISQLEREELAKRHLELAPTARERVFMQRFYLYLVMTKPSGLLYLTCARVGGDGQSLRRSYLLGTMHKLFPKVEVTEIEALPIENLIVTPKSSLIFYLEEIQRRQEGGLPLERRKRQLWNALKQWYENDEIYRTFLTHLTEAEKLRYEGNEISRAVSKALYGNVLENSVTRLERFAACACAHFLNYGLRLNERELSQFAAMDMGVIYHLALEKYAAMLGKSQYDWFTIPKEAEEEMIEAALREAVLESGNQALAQTAKNQYFLYRMGKILKTTVHTLTEQVRAGRFEPGDFEMAFAFTEDLEAVNFALTEEEKMHLRGRIDRVDTYEADGKLYVKVIDYKSGKTSFDLLALYHGLQLQLVVYLNAAVEILKKKHPTEEIVPAGVFYYHIDDPVIEGSGGETDVEIYEQILDKLKLDGLVNESDRIYEAMDTDIAGKSKVIPVGFTKDGALTKTSKTATDEEFALISDYVSHLVQRLGRQIVEGEVKVNPYQLKDKEACTYCPYGSVCGYDGRIPGYEHRKLDDIGDADEIMQKMKEIGREDM